MDIANSIYDLLMKDKGVSFRIYNWPSTCPMPKKAEKYSQKELQALLQSIIVGFIKLKHMNDGSDGEAVVLRGTMVYMEAFSVGKSKNIVTGPWKDGPNEKKRFCKP